MPAEQMTPYDSQAETTREHPVSKLLGAADVRRLAAALQLNPAKRLGQNFVIDPGTVRRITHEASVGPGDHILEVGPGLGSLTLALLEAGAEVVAVEIDTRLAGLLPHTVAKRMPEAACRFSVINADALTLTPENVGVEFAETRFTLVANLPYNVATPIILTLLERFPNLGSFLVMVQREVADRLVATPGSKTYGTPTVKLAWYGHAERAGSIGRNVFWPTPNVDSALVRFQRYDTKLEHKPPSAHAQEHETSITAATETADHTDATTRNVVGTVESGTNPEGPGTNQDSIRAGVFHIVDLAFAQRRKTLRAALRGSVPDQAFSAAGIDPVRRGETLTIRDFTTLYRAATSPSPQPRVSK